MLYHKIKCRSPSQPDALTMSLLNSSIYLMKTRVLYVGTVGLNLTSCQSSAAHVLYIPTYSCKVISKLESQSECMKMAIHWFGISRTNTGYPELSSQSVHAKKYSYAHHSYFFVIV